MTKTNKIIIFALILATLTRLPFLMRYPSLGIDEVAIGYDAFSILKTGHDQYQQKLPLVFASLGDYKSGLYIYLVSICQLIFGVNEFSIRFPSALSGIITIYFFYKLASHILKNKKIALIATLLLSISPWHIKLSRTALEANVALLFFTSGLYLFLKNINRPKKLLLPLLLLILTTYTYHSYKVITPATLLFLSASFWSQFKKTINKFPLIIIYIFILLIPQFILLTNKQSQIRSGQTIFLNDPNVTQRNDYQQLSAFDKTWSYFINIVRRYFQYFDPSFLFVNGLDLSIYQHLDQGPLYLIESLFLIGGGLLFLKNKQDLFSQKKHYYLFIFLLLISPLPAAITINDFHIIRSSLLILPLLVLVAFYLNYFQSKHKNITKFIIIPLYIISLIFFIDYYTIIYHIHQEEGMFSGSKQMAQKVVNNIDKYQKIIIDPQFGKIGPYLYNVPDQYILFYGQISPVKKWNKTSIMEKIEIRHIDYGIDRSLKNTLLVGSPWSLPIDSQSLIDQAFYQDGQPVYLFIKTDN